jgi:CubicO group peptidase (beta-lactamase class C family)
MGITDGRTVTAGDIDGVVEPGYGVVADAFRRSFDELGEVGASLCVHVEGVPVLDVAAGQASPGAPYRRDTAQVLFSATKGVTAVIASMLAERGVLDLDAPVASVWPEFAVNGKDRLPVSWILSHRSGVLGTGRAHPMNEVLDGRRITAELARAIPAWEPGTRHGYHGVSYGWLMAEVIRRTDGRSIGTILAEDVAGPLGLDLWIGLPAELEGRVAPVLELDAPPPEAAAWLEDLFAPGSLGWRSLTFDGSFDFGLLSSTYNRTDVHAAELPASGGIGTARGLSRLYAACIGEVDGTRLIGTEQVDRARAEAVRGTDAIWGFETAFGLGFWLHTDQHPKLGPGSFGHSGPQCLGFADPDTGVAFGYVANQPGIPGNDPRVATPRRRGASRHRRLSRRQRPLRRLAPLGRLGAAVLDISLLGEQRVVAGEEPLRVLSPRTLGLLGFLVLHPGAPQLRAHVAGVFWPDSTDEQARTNLRRELHQLRRALPDPDRCLVVDASSLCWRADAAATVDVVEFERAAAEAERADRAGDTGAVRRCRRARRGGLRRAVHARVLRRLGPGRAPGPAAPVHLPARPARDAGSGGWRRTGGDRARPTAAGARTAGGGGLPLPHGVAGRGWRPGRGAADVPPLRVHPRARAGADPVRGHPGPAPPPPGRRSPRRGPSRRPPG